MNKPNDLPVRLDADDIGWNDSPNPDFASIVQARMSRRQLLRISAAGAGTALLGSLGLSACGGGANIAVEDETETLLGFSAVPKSLADTVSVPAGYTATVLYALGDPLTDAIPAFKNDGTDADFENRAGDHHDGMEFFPLSAAGTPSATASERGLLAMNHEATTDEGTYTSFFLHADGGTPSLPRPAAEVDKEVAVHGVSVVEVRKSGGTWQTVQGSTFNTRITPLTEVDLSGPVRGHALVHTKYSSDGTVARGTLNNCGTGKTPWGTLLTGEENWAGYFARAAGDNAARGNDKSVTSLNRYGRPEDSESRHGWETAGADDKYARWNISVLGASATDDYRNELNTMGYVVEIDPYDKTRRAKKRTALGRFAHESAAFGRAVAGSPLAVYMGDDSRGEYIYKFVSTVAWNAADADPANRLATGDKYLDSGKLYVARFNANGSGEWVELSIANPDIAGYAGYAFADQADVLVNARLAADAVGATKMDRPEWCAVNPANGEIYCTLTNNSNRRVEPTGSQVAPDAANPRVYTDIKNGNQNQVGNPNGHIIRIREGAAGSTATAFTWDVYLFGAEAGADPQTVNLSRLTDDQDFSSPDGLAFAPSTGLCWFQTDDGAYTDVTNCMMLAALPGRVGDGGQVTLSYPRSGGQPDLQVTTHVGASASAGTLKRFLVGPKGSEITGICETPDGKALFVNIQHPGESTAAANIGNPAQYQSQWPSNAGYGAGARPRSATIVITKDDGGRIGT